MRYQLLMTCIVFSLMTSISYFDLAYGQTSVNVTETTTCFLNYTAGVDAWSNCGADEDYISFALLPFEWVTGGFFSMILVTILIVISYIKYHNVIYPIAIGIMFLPTSFFLFPDIFLSYAIVMMIIGIGGGIYYALVVKANKD